MKKYLLLVLLNSVFNSYGQKIPWKISSPEAQGMNSLTLSDGIRELQQAGTNIHSLLIIRNNHVVLDAVFYPYRQQYAHDIASVTKSVMSLLVGIAIDKGFIRSEQDTVLNYFPGHTIRNSALKILTIKDLVNMASGFQCSSANREKELEQMQDQADWAGFMLDLPFSSKPGEKFSYCSGNFYLLAEILQRATKMKCHDFARKYLFDALQFGTTYWDQNKKGVNHGWGDLYMRPYDMAKIGALLLQEGKWNGKQVVSARWIQKIQPLYYVHGTESYGYGWWLDSESPDEIQAMGRGGQRMFVLKDKNVVIVTTGGGFDAGEMDNLVVNAIAAYQPGENHYAELLQRVKQIQLPDTGNSQENNFSAGMLNKTFQMENNDLEITAFRFEKGSKDYYLILDIEDGGKQKLAIGMGNRYVISHEHLFGLPVALRSFWKKEKLLVEYNSLSSINLYRFTFVFDNDSVDFRAEDITNKRNISLKASAAN
ncbi:serine hydrolase domain-containing protein [Chitinophaga japonensis]|uniref:CubicO group peptidase (Beta-lactamase class C family) n=1 Tax=Chitinophaga japonensis TaxID=104662 RepID=A0A562TCS9_CHIJA|nr:serine hydrolase [Chitinophaga japonensis]TWI91295.1 CubicO group peptidase (beta-lactamase class C family) [Chitinophaga japonensis]